MELEVKVDKVPGRPGALGKRTNPKLACGTCIA